MKVLAIETSCDETGVAILEGEKTPAGFSFTTLAQALNSQAPLHREYGGVYPTLAKREHEKNLPVLLEQVLGSLTPKYEVDAIAVTGGPGLEPALWTGISFAEKLAREWKKPVFSVNHMEGHFLSSLVRGGRLENVSFPVLGLLVSGGHSEFVLASDWFRYKIIGETLDDAAGEAFDKVARMMGLPYPGGPEISRLARSAREAGLPASRVPLPRPMLQSGNCDVSFSGLKTAALYALRDMGGIEKLADEERAAFAREFEDSVADVFAAKTRRALRETGAQIFALGGGVAANEHLRSALVRMIEQDFPEVSVRIPEPKMTGDNAEMIAVTALIRLLSGSWRLDRPHEKIRAAGSLSLEESL